MKESILLFIFGLILLIKGGDWFVDGATKIARRFKIPEIIVGATVVSIGTTLPEVMVSVSGALAGQGAMAYGNAIGSIICNTSLIAALTIAIKPAPVNTKTLVIPTIFFFASAAIYVISAYIFGEFYRWVGILLLLVFVVYMVLTVRSGLKERSAVPEISEEHEDEEKKTPLYMDLIWLVLGAAVIAVGADLLVEHGTIIAKTLGVPETVIALTFVALGTSLPELVTAITSLLKGHGSLSLGNIIGANIFNLVLVSGTSIALAPFEVPVGNEIFGINSSLVLDIPLMLAVMAFMIFPTFFTKKLSRYQGIALLAVYAAFCTLQFVL
jgi:cation:H+ antiporter